MARVPENIGKYKVISSLGRGATSQVYKAVHPELKEPVVLKKLTVKGNKTALERFKREAQLMMRLRHENIVMVYDFFKQGSSYITVQEYVEGQNLSQMLASGGRLDEVSAGLIIMQVARALNYIHKRSIVHRDVKPSNIFIAANGEVKLGDFGLVHLTVGEEDGLTREGALLGTPGYMAPEQNVNPSAVDRRADIYALGLTWYECLWENTFKGTLPERLELMSHGSGKMIEKAIRRKTFLRYRTLNPIIRKLRRVIGLKGGHAVTEINNRLGNKKSDKINNSIEKGALPKQVVSFIPAMLLLLTLIVAARPLWYESIAAKRFGAITFNYDKDIDYSLVVEIYKSGDETPIREIDPSKRLFGISKRVYLPIGEYSLNFRNDGGSLRHYIYLSSRAEQKEVAQEKNGYQVLIPDFDFISHRVNFNINFRSSETNEKITPQIFIFDEDSWISIFNYEKGFYTGSSYLIRAKKDGFQNWQQEIQIGKYETKVELQPVMMENPATIHLLVEDDTAGFLLNGKSNYVDYTPDGGFSIIKNQPGEQQLNIKPGEYELSLKGFKNEPILLNLYSSDIVYIDIIKKEDGTSEILVR